MKRSEAIQLIANIVYELNVDSEECDFEADKILTKLEKAGMLPPYVTEPVPTHIVVQEGPFGPPQFVRIEDSKSFVSKWEDETET